MSWRYASGGQSVGASALASVLLMKIQCWFPLGLTGLISLLSKELTRVLSSTSVQKHQFRTILVKWLRFHASTAGSMGSFYGWGTKIPHASRHDPKQKNKHSLIILPKRTFWTLYQAHSLRSLFMTNLDSILKRRDITLPTKVVYSKLWFFQ